ncbi:pyridoxal phosphate-dependent transferase [Naematelia encephala]|uniref:Pyridoxal phosphate-dependent transferase n=1 Tax=Naematelia encephala TaxID=71784 RepID=A0A1Y2BBW5_9TREE|nr:pyridoxal phosphate-dependent transferase [Naematelia encephala]
MSIQKYRLKPRPGALEAIKEAYSAKNPESKAAFDEAVTVLPGGGTRKTLYVDPFPLFITGGKGQHVTDVDGHEYWDLAGDFVSGLYGKTNPILRSAIMEALDSGIQLGMHTKKEAEFATLIRDRLPSMELIRFTNSGTEANLQAICASMHYTGRSKVAVFSNSYHGGVVADFYPGGARANEPGSLTLKVPFDYLICPYNDLEKTRELVNDLKDDVACIIVEPMQGAGGCIPGTPEFLRGLRELSKAIGAVLIFDEIQTARLAYNGLQGVYEIKPDMTTIGKYFGGGLAFGAYGGRKEIMSMFDTRKAVHVKVGGTFNNSIMTVSAGIAALRYVMTRPALEKVNTLGDMMRAEIMALFAKLGAPFEMTGVGAINEIHCLLPGPEGLSGQHLLFFGLLDKGIAIAQRGLCALTLLAEEGDIHRLTRAIQEVLEGDLFCSI